MLLQMWFGSQLPLHSRLVPADHDEGVRSLEPPARAPDQDDREEARDENAEDADREEPDQDEGELVMDEQPAEQLAKGRVH